MVSVRVPQLYHGSIGGLEQRVAVAWEKSMEQRWLRKKSEQRESWEKDRMDAQEELESYEVTMRNNHGSGYKRFLAELSEISRIRGSMAELVEIGSSEALLQNLPGSVASCLYDRSDGNQLEDASITDPEPRRHQTRNGPQPDEVGALYNNELGARRWAPSSGAR
ncbi:uncharacterized protein UBRO_20510 [Ustilago bromivora]|uniref:Uncharacterized protein n=1 Tax=Ustilago bromivora TaxID=307758 RepID=A0A1K0FZ09_9BASI|nr:uncharacterized protein UBRO_20510 [Ustilago bromivora]